MALTETTDKSAILILFEDIETVLQDLLDDGTIYSVEVFNQQTDFEDQERPRNYPFVMVDITVDWGKPEMRSSLNSLDKIKQPHQKGQCTVTIHTIFEHLENETTSFKEIEPIRFLVHRAVNNLQNDNYFTKLQRLNTLVDSSHDRVIDMITTYQCEIIEAHYVDSTKTSQTSVVPVVTYDLDIDNEAIRTGDGTV